jgi:hypothetical protein
MVVTSQGSHIFKKTGAQMAMRFSVLNAGSLLPPGRFLALISVKMLSQHQGHSVAGRIRPTENSNDIGNQICDLPACSTGPQPTTPLCAPNVNFILMKYFQYIPTLLTGHMCTL